VTPWNAFDFTHNGGDDIFVVGLEATDGSQFYGSYLGGSGREEGFALAVDRHGRVTVAGSTASSNFPLTADAVDSHCNGLQDAVVATLTADGSALETATCLGGEGAQTARALALSPFGVLAAGHTNGLDFPGLEGATVHGGGGAFDVFVVLLSLPEVPEVPEVPGDDESPLTVIDFEDWPAGTILDDQIPGVTVSALNGTLGPRRHPWRDRRGARPGLGHPDVAVIFDSAAPTGGDYDLQTPGYGTGNTAAQGHVLIIAEKAIDRDGDGLVDVPDDEANGGILRFDFHAPVDLVRLTVIDIEEEGGELRLYSEGELVFGAALPASDDNSVQHLSLARAPLGVDALELVLAGSGAVDDLVYCAEPPCVPDEAPAELVVLEDSSF
jgi:hypothetical protein